MGSMQYDDPPRAERGYVADPRNPWVGIPGLALAMKLCRARGEDGVWHGLPHFTKEIPAEFVATACTIGRGPEVFVVSCPCGAREFVAGALIECRGGCDRWFFADQWRVYAIKLPEQDPDE